MSRGKILFLAETELVAEYVQKNLLTDESRIREIVNFKPGFAKSIMNVIDKLLASLGDSAAYERTMLYKTKKMYADALNGTQTSFDADTSKKKKEDLNRFMYRSACLMIITF